MLIICYLEVLPRHVLGATGVGHLGLPRVLSQGVPSYRCARFSWLFIVGFRTFEEHFMFSLGDVGRYLVSHVQLIPMLLRTFGKVVIWHRTKL